MANYGRTWWGKQWLRAFTGIDYSNRLPRGRTYANKGRAYDISIKTNIITARVDGSYPQPYKVSISLPKFDRAIQESIRSLIVSSPSILSALINKQLPSTLLEKLNDYNIKLFPADWSEVDASCDCPDWAVPCKHIAAVIYLICVAIDNNPFVVFSIHDCDLLSLVSDFGVGSLKDCQRIPLLSETLGTENKQEWGTATYEEIIEQINFSKVKDLSSNIITILRDSPPFSEKNFRDTLAQVYRYWQKSPYGAKERYPHLSSQDKSKTENEIFSATWHNPELWPTFYLVIDNEHGFIGAYNGEKTLFTSLLDLLKFFKRYSKCYFA